jgi:hypothetical protein
MPQRSPGIAVPGGFTRAQVGARYEQYVREHFGELDIPSLCEVMWSSGGREMKDALVEFSDMLPMLRDFEKRCARLEAVLRGVLELGHDERAYAWAMSNATTEEHELEDLPF